MNWTQLMDAPVRELRVGGRIVFESGQEIPLTGALVSALTVEEGADGALAPGCVLSARCTLDLVNDAGQWRPDGALLGGKLLCGATLLPELGAVDGDEVQWRALGAFQVESARYMEGEAVLRLQAVDSIGCELSAPFEDALAYPATLAALWRHAIAQTRYAWSGEVPNGDGVIDAAPDWKGCSLRGALGNIAAAAGCFVCVDRSGSLALRPLWSGGTGARSIDAQTYLKLERDGETYGPVDSLRLLPVGAEEECVYRAVEGGSALYSISVSNNPLFQAGAAGLDGLARGMLSSAAGFASASMRFSWRGDPELGVGDRVRLTDAAGEVHEGVVSRQTLSLSQGFSASCTCATPEVDSSGVRRILTPEGGLNAAALCGAVDGALLSVGSITTSKLAASSVTAEKLEAGSVDAHVVAAVAGKFGTIDAGNIETDALGAELARISRLVARTADIDWAHIKDLTTDTAIITQGVGGKLMISRLAVTEANMVSLTTGELVVKGADGSFYAVSVDENGEIVATRKQIGNDDVVDLSINAGEKLIEGSVTTACLNATEIFADSAVVRELIAANLDVDRLFAREAFIDRLATSSIVGGRSLTAIAGTADAAKSAAEAAQGTAEAAQGTADAARSAAEAAQSSADTAQSAADAAKSAADTAQSAAEAAQGTADGAMLATAHVGVKPPEAPIPAGRQWLDQGVEPWTLRSWIGADVRTEPEYAQTHSGNPVVLDEGRVLSLDSIRNSFAPVQAGSGDPYPAGGGKNLLPYFSAETKNGITLSVANDGTITLNGTPSANTVFVVNLASALPTGTYTMSLRSNAVNGYMAVWLENTDDWSTIGSVPNGALNNSKSFESTKEYHRAKLVVYTSAGTLSNLQLKIQLERGSAATEYAPYANIRPISGRTGAKLTRCGKNLMGNEADDLLVGADGVLQYFNPALALVLPVCGIDSICVSGDIALLSDKVVRVGLYNQYPTIGTKGVRKTYGHMPFVLDVSGVEYVALSFLPDKNTNITKEQVHAGICVNIGTEPISEPYNGDTYAASFGQTVYGGTLDWAAGVLAVEWAIVKGVFSRSTIDSSGKLYSILGVPSSVASHLDSESVTPYIVCTALPSKGLSAARSFSGASISQYGKALYIGGYVGRESELDALIASDDFAICYRLAEPIVVQLNLPAVYPLEGTNVLYGGTGALEVDSTASGWRVVNDPAELQSAQEALALQQARMDEALNRLGMAMVLDADGVHVHRPVTNPPCETLTADDSFNVLVNSAIAATFAASYQKMGGQIVVRQTSNGLIFGG